MYKVQTISHLQLDGLYCMDIPSPGGFQNIDFLIRARQGSEHVNRCGSNEVKAAEA